MDRQQLEALLVNRFPGATPSQIAAAANAIMALARDDNPNQNVSGLQRMRREAAPRVR